MSIMILFMMSIKNLVDSENEIELNLTIKFKGISVTLMYPATNMLDSF
jgi:hypothetical protein